MERRMTRWGRDGWRGAGRRRLKSWVGLVWGGGVCITFALFRPFVLHLSQLHLRAILLPTQAAYTTILAIPGIPDPLLRTAVWI